MMEHFISRPAARITARSGEHGPPGTCPLLWARSEQTGEHLSDTAPEGQRVTLDEAQDSGNSLHDKPIITRRQRITGMEASHVRAARGQRSHSAGLIPDPVRSRRGSSAEKPHESNTLVVSPTSPHIELLPKGPDQAEQRVGGLLQ